MLQTLLLHYQLTLNLDRFLSVTLTERYKGEIQESIVTLKQYRVEGQM